MKKLMLIVIVISMNIFCGCIPNNKGSVSASDYLRIHIRANSNNVDDQNIKYLIKDSIVEYLSPIIAECKSKECMMDAVNDNLTNIENVANDMLADNGFEYVSNAYISKEYFPTRVYGDVTLDADIYDAIIVELGSGEGNNWWCVVYPPLCFVNADEVSTAGFKYKSKLKEIIDKFFN